MEATVLNTMYDADAREASRCIGCGTCVTVCPVFAEEGREALTARGRNARFAELWANAERDGVDADLSACLACGRCSLFCPQGLPNDRLVTDLRTLAAQRHGLPLLKKAAFRALLLNRRRMGRALRLAAAMQKVLPATRDVELGYAQNTALPPVRHLPLFFARLAQGRHLPPINGQFLAERVPEVTPPAKPGIATARVLFFAGCAMEFVVPQAAQAMVQLVSELGMEVIVPREQGCCGTAAYANGDRETALAMARHNVALIEEVAPDVVMTGCATCGSALRSMWQSLAESPEEKRRFAAVARKTRDFSELVQAHSFPDPFPYASKLPQGARVTWHGPCHLTHHQHVSREPVALLQRAMGKDFSPLPSRCCGFGGSFNVSHYGLSTRIGERKVQDLRAVNADFIVTECPGCMIQLVDLIAKNQLAGKVVHLAEAMGLATSRA